MVSVTQPSEPVKGRNGKTDRGTSTFSFELVFALRHLFGWWLVDVIHSFQRRKRSYQRINSKSCQMSKIPVVSSRTTAATSFHSTALQPHILSGRISNRRLGCTGGSNTAGLSAPQPLHINYSSSFATRTSGAILHTNYQQS